MDKNFDAIIAAPFGAVGISAQDDFLVKLQLIPSSQPEKTSSDPFVQHVVNTLKRYFRDPHTPLDIPIATTPA